jgi:hypothetical protein
MNSAAKYSSIHGVAPMRNSEAWFGARAGTPRELAPRLQLDHRVASLTREALIALVVSVREVSKRFGPLVAVHEPYSRSLTCTRNAPDGITCACRRASPACRRAASRRC